ncbi:MAG TPA: hypothetical protein VM253_07180 [Candidatus Limnocylindrales bacterium]|nr:hypothetical protein [Candidatus Limnocylindrales bacterium]
MRLSEAHRVPRSASGLLYRSAHHEHGESMGRILIGVIIGVILVIWLLASCVGAIF